MRQSEVEYPVATADVRDVLAVYRDTDVLQERQDLISRVVVMLGKSRSRTRRPHGCKP